MKARHRNSSACVPERKTKRRVYLCERLENRRLLSGTIDFGLAGGAVLQTLDAVQSNVTSKFRSVSAIPILGSELETRLPGLGNVVSQVDQIGSLLQGLGTLPIDNSSIDPIQNAIYPFLSGNQLLGNTDKLGGIDKHDIMVLPAGDGSSMGIHILLSHTLVNASNSLQFGLDLGKLMSFDAPTGEHIDLTLGYDLSFHISAGTPSSPSQVTLDSGDTPLTITAAVKITGMSLHGNLGFLGLSANDEGSQFSAGFGFGLDPQGGVSSFVLSGDVALKLGLGLTLRADPGQSASGSPTFSSDFKLGWHFDHNIIGQDPVSFGTLTQLSFDHVSVHLDQLLPGFIQSAIGEVQSFVKPLFPILDFINRPIPGLSDIGIHKSIRDLLNDGNMLPGPFGNILDALTFIRDLRVTGATGAALDLGSLSLADGNSTLSDVINGNFASHTSGLADPNAILGQANLATGGFFTQMGTKIAFSGIPDPTAYGLQFPILTDPAGSVFKLFLGQKADLFTYDMKPTISQCGGEASVGIPILANVKLAAGIELQGDLSVGYDTTGISEFLKTGDVAALRDGFYINNKANDATDPRGQHYTHYDTGIDFHGFMDAGIEVLLLQVTGGLFANASLHLDPKLNDTDGKVRLDKIWNTIVNNPLHLFATSGQIYASIDAGAGFSTPFGDVTIFSFNVGRAVLVDWDTSPSPAAPLTSDAPPTTIYLHMTAGDDRIVVHDYQKSYPDTISGELTTEYGIQVDYYNNTDSHTDTYRTRIYKHDEGVVPSNFPNLNLIATDGDSGGNDSIIIQTDDADGGYAYVGSSSLNAVLIGGSGNDDFEYYANGDALLVGEAGNDRLVGGGQEYGGQGDANAVLALPWASAFYSAVLAANLGESFDDNGTQADVLIGTVGADVLQGGPGTNTFYGLGGNDTERGGGKNDLFQLAEDDGGGTSSIFGGGGNDTVRVLGYPGNPIYPTYLLQNTSFFPSISMNFSAAAIAVDSLDSKKAVLIDGLVSSVVRDVACIAVNSAGNQNNITVNDLSSTALKGLYLDVYEGTFEGPLIQAADTVKIVGGQVNDNYVVQSTPSAYGHSAVDVANNNRAIPFHVVVEGMDSLDTLILDGGVGLDDYTVKLDTSMAFNTRITDSGNDHSNITVDGTKFTTGDTDVDVNVSDYLQRVGNLGFAYWTQARFLVAFEDGQGNFTNVSSGVSFVTQANVDLHLTGANAAHGTVTQWNINTDGTRAISIDGGNGDSAGDGDTYNITNYGGTLRVKGGNGDDTFNVNTNRTPGLNGGDGSDSYNIAMPGSNGPWTIGDTGTTGSDSLTVDDSKNFVTSRADYYVAGGSIVRVDSAGLGLPARTAQINFSHMGSVDLTTGTGLILGNYLWMDVGAPTAFAIHTGLLLNRVMIGEIDEDLDSFTGGSIAVYGQPGTTLSVNDLGSAASSIIYTMGGSVLTGFRYIPAGPLGTPLFVPTAPVSFSNIDAFSLKTAPATAVVSVLSTTGAGQVTIDAGASSAPVIVGDGSHNLNDIGTLSVHGGAGAALTVDDRANVNGPYTDPNSHITYSESTSPRFTVGGGSLARNNDILFATTVARHAIIIPATYSSQINFSGFSSAVLFNKSGDSLTWTPGATFTVGNSNDQMPLSITQGMVTLTPAIPPSAASAKFFDNVTVGSGATLKIAGSVKFDSLTLTSQSHVKLLPDSSWVYVLTVNTLTLDPTAQLDLVDNAMVVDYFGNSPLATVQGLIAAGTAGGNGIISSLALGMPMTLLSAEAGDIFSAFPTTFLAQPVDRSSVIVRFTDPADKNLDGIVDGKDSQSYFYVLNTNDSGPGSLRQAILDINSSSGRAGTIAFFMNSSDPRHFYYRNDGVAGKVTAGNVAMTSAETDSAILDIDPDWAHSWWSIRPLSELPAITSQIYIAGQSQPGSHLNTLAQGDNAVIRIELTGTGSSGRGLVIRSSGVTVQGLAINNFLGSSQVDISGDPTSPLANDTVIGSFIGTDVSGTIAERNASLGLVTPGIAVSNYANSSTVGGLDPSSRNVISGNGGSGVILGEYSNSNLVENNYIGVTASGGTALPNGVAGIDIAGGYNGSLNNIIGGTSGAARNILSGNATNGILAEGNVLDTVIQGNYIGLDAAGTRALGNGADGILVSVTNKGASLTSGMFIGGTTPGAGNVISANGGDGILVRQGDGGDLIQGNLIGTSASGSAPLGNARNGIEFISANAETVGGTDLGAGNVISGNGLNGISISSVKPILIQGNWIGTDSAGTIPIGNRRDGIFISDSGKASVGGTDLGAGNTIACNGVSSHDSGIGIPLGNGVQIFANTINNPIEGNSIHDNMLLGIDLNNGTTGGDGVTNNDANDFDNGSNMLQNYPVLTSAATSTSGTTISASLTTKALTTYRIEFFANAAGDSTNHGEGQTFIGFANVTTDGSGFWSGTVQLPTLPANQNVISATATDPGWNTSEFSADITATVLRDATTTVHLLQAIQSVGRNVTIVMGEAPSSGSGTTTGSFALSIDNGTPITLPVPPIGFVGYTTSSLGVGTHTIKVGYSGDSSFASNDVTLTETIVNPVSTTTSLTESAVTAPAGQSVSLIATVTPTGPAAPTGTVTFYDGGVLIGSASLAAVGGKYQANLSSTSFAIGSHSFTAIYSGDAAFLGCSARGNIVSIAGGDIDGYNGDNQPARGALLQEPTGVAVDSAGNVFIADMENNRLREVLASNGQIITIAGTGTPGYNGDDQPAVNATLSEPRGVAVDGAGNVFVADYGNGRIREVVASTGKIITVAGNGLGYNGDDQPATQAQLNDPSGVAVDAAGNIVIADSRNNRIREVFASTGLIETIAGTGDAGYNGDNQDPTSAQLNSPTGVAVDSLGHVYIADAGNQRVREVMTIAGASAPTIITLAGTGTPGYNGDGQPASAAQLDSPQGVAVDGAGNVFISETSGERIREMIAGSGKIITIAGTGSDGATGDNVPAIGATLFGATGISVDSAGNVFLAESRNNRIRELMAALPLTVTPAGTPPDAPRVLNAVFDYRQTEQKLTLTFNEDVSASLESADLILTNQTTGEVMRPAQFDLNWDAASDVATWTFAPGALPDGNYQARLLWTTVRDTAGNPLDGNGDGTSGDDDSFSFFSLAGDVNRDRIVDEQDENLVTAALGSAGVRPQDGDANGDGMVNFSDLVAVAQHYGKTDTHLFEGDFNGDKSVNFADLVAVAQNYGRSGRADLDGDNSVTQADINLVVANFGNSLPGPVAALPVALSAPVAAAAPAPAPVTAPLPIKTMASKVSPQKSKAPGQTRVASLRRPAIAPISPAISRTVKPLPGIFVSVRPTTPSRRRRDSSPCGPTGGIAWKQRRRIPRLAGGGNELSPNKPAASQFGRGVKTMAVTNTPSTGGGRSWDFRR